jgi:hypothetical protein
MTTLANTEITTRKIKGSDLSTVNTDLNPSHIPVDLSAFSGFNAGETATNMLQLTQLLVNRPGEKGDAATVTVGSVTTGASGSSATISNSGSNTAAVLDFSIPKGNTGDTGPQAIPSSIALNQPSTNNYTLTFTYPDSTAVTTTSSFNVQAGVDGRGISTVALADHPSDTTLKRFTFTFDDSSADQTADFTKPIDGTSPSFTAGTITALASSATPTFTITGTSSNPVMNLGIPKGVDGTGAVSTVNDSLPDSSGNVTISVDPAGTALQLAIALS